MFHKILPEGFALQVPSLFRHPIKQKAFPNRNDRGRRANPCYHFHSSVPRGTDLIRCYIHLTAVKGGPITAYKIFRKSCSPHHSEAIFRISLTYPSQHPPCQQTTVYPALLRTRIRDFSVKSLICILSSSLRLCYLNNYQSDIENRSTCL